MTDPVRSNLALFVIGTGPTSDTRQQSSSGIHYTVITGLVLSTTCLAIRLLTRHQILRKITAEDLCLTIAWGFCVGTQIVILYALDHAGLGHHIEYLSVQTISTYEKLFLTAACLFITGICLARLAHLVLFHRLMIAKSWLRHALYGVTAFVIIGSITLVFCFIFACRPISKAWDVTLQGQCINRPAILVAVAVLNIISDFLLILLPIPVISDLQVPRSQKIKTFIILVMVCITFVASAIRLRFTVPLLSSSDLTYKIAPVALLVGVESNLIIITATLPALKQFLFILVSKLGLVSVGSDLLKACSRTQEDTNSHDFGAP
ncbi:hypothetical protein C8Q69DRAFT_520247 [Paecilomyces variotii]|uniref:Rhodopsin domain-containing protein n=1 Tax=Byssochlamys spectabilis TaxID=264951 RepID=A0A443HUC4_BYSSP|nr:hypothetical protein C8Q69DRAFT_520247 [Paecilomyces variotii]RWQ95413.1 hypothetical protein C8Q69DRAFT_520247 [Paecilomyces variotii]